MTAEPLSVVILTKDEAGVIERAIASVLPIAGEIVVVDSDSTDDTVAIAERLGARVVPQPWLGWLPQKRVGVDACRHDWILTIDADEVVTPELAASIARALGSGPDPRDGFTIDRRDEFRGKLMPPMTRPAKRRTYVRLFNRRYGDWDPAMEIHEVIRCPGALIPLAGLLLHWRNYSIAAQVTTFNRYSDLEARLILRDDGFSASRLVGKPALRFLWIYVACGNWRMGMHGFVWAMLHAFAEFLRQAKAWEAVRTGAEPHPPRAAGRDGVGGASRSDRPATDDGIREGVREGVDGRRA